MKFFHNTYFVFSLILFFACKQTETTLPPPNIVWITAEDISPMLGCYGDTYAQTPNIDQLANEGVRFLHAFSNAPVCSPARATLVTGVYASTLGSQHLRSQIKKPDFIEGFPKYLREAGYYCTNNDKEDYNFIDSTIWNESSKKAHWKNRPEGKPFFSVFNLGITHQSQIFGDEATFLNRIGNIERQNPADAPVPPYFFDTPEIRKYVARYYDNIKVMDQQVGDILKELDEAGLSENTIVFFFSDHGTGMPRSKRTAYDSGLQVPLIIKAPPQYEGLLDIQPGSIDDNLVGFVDFAPTMLSLLDIDIPTYMQGEVFLGKNKVQKEFAFGFSDRVDEAFETARSVRTKDYVYVRNYLPQYPLIQDNFYTDQSEIMQVLRKGKEELDLSPAQQAMWIPRRYIEELYDVQQDPFQVNNLAANPEDLAASQKKVLESLRTAHKDWMLKTHDSGLMPESAMHQYAGDSSIVQALQNPDIFPVETIWQVSEANRLADLDQLNEFLRHENEVVRYWAANAFAYHADKIIDTQQLIKLLQDNIPYVRIAAAEALCLTGDCTHMEVVMDILENETPILQLMAARALELNFDKIPTLHQRIKKVNEVLTKQVEGRWYGYDLYANWALNEALK